VADDIAAQIASGELAPGARLRSERDLAAHYGVSYGTIRRAMEVLRDRSLITTIHGARDLRRQDVTAAQAAPAARLPAVRRGLRRHWHETPGVARHRPVLDGRAGDRHALHVGHPGA
jgi:GntR family transcriptional regulator